MSARRIDVMTRPNEPATTPTTTPATTPATAARLAAEFLGTFLLVLGGCGAAVLAADPAGDFSAGIGDTGVALAAGLAMLAGFYAVGAVSGGHFNPAVTLAAAIAKRVEWSAVPRYWLSQVTGAVLAGLAIVAIGNGRPSWTPVGNMAANGYGQHSPFYFSLTAVLISEVILTMVFVAVFLAVTDGGGPRETGGLVIGLAFTLVHLIAIPVSNAGLNPARSTGVAFFNGAGAPGQLWVFWVAPLVGAAITGALYPALSGRRRAITNR